MNIYTELEAQCTVCQNKFSVSKVDSVTLVCQNCSCSELIFNLSVKLKCELCGHEKEIKKGVPVSLSHICVNGERRFMMKVWEVHYETYRNDSELIPENKILEEGEIKETKKEEVEPPKVDVVKKEIIRIKAKK